MSYEVLCEDTNSISNKYVNMTWHASKNSERSYQVYVTGEDCNASFPISTDWYGFSESQFDRRCLLEETGMSLLGKDGALRTEAPGNWREDEAPGVGRLIMSMSRGSHPAMRWHCIKQGDWPISSMIKAWKYISYETGWRDAKNYYPAENERDVLDIFWANGYISEGVVASSINWQGTSINYKPLFYRVREERRWPKVTHKHRDVAPGDKRKFIEVLTGPNTKYLIACSKSGIRVTNTSTDTRHLDLQVDPKIIPTAALTELIEKIVDFNEMVRSINWLLNHDGCDPYPGGHNA